MVDYFYTLGKISEGLFKDRGSKFIAIAQPVGSEEEIKSHLEEYKKKYHDARHHCYAWRIGTNPVEARANDDGEPSNSAGKPILNQLEKNNLTNALIVVVRYFGGTLLGVGGLINAYRSASEIAIANNNITKRFVYNTYIVYFEYPAMNSVMGILKQEEIESFDQRFELNCSLKFKVRLRDEQKLIKHFNLIQNCELKLL